MDDKTEKPVQFEDLHLLPGHKLQIAFDGFTNERERSVLLGYRQHHSLMVTTPTINGNPISLNVGATLTVRSFIAHMGCAYAFRTEVLHILRRPYPHLHLAMPAEVVLGEIRSSARAKTALQATVTGKDKESHTVVIQDLSVGGVGVLAKSLPIVEGEKVVLSARLMVNKLERLVDLEGVVRTVTTLAKKVSVGIQFVDMAEKDSLAVYAYVLENLQYSL